MVVVIVPHYGLVVVVGIDIVHVRAVVLVHSGVGRRRGSSRRRRCRSQQMTGVVVGGCAGGGVAVHVQGK